MQTLFPATRKKIARQRHPPFVVRWGFAMPWDVYELFVNLKITVTEHFLEHHINYLRTALTNALETKTEVSSHLAEMAL